MSFTLPQILGGFLAPAVLVALVAGFAFRLAADARWIFGPLVAVAFSIAYSVVQSGIGWPPTANVLYLPFYFTIVGGVLTLADSLFKPPIWLRVLILVILWRITVRLMLIHQVPNALSASNAEMWIDLSTLITAIWFILFEGLADRAPGITAPLLLFGMSGVSAIVLALGWHIQSSGSLAGVLALISLAGVITSVISRRASFSRGFAQMIVVILQLLLVHGYFYTDDNLTDTQQVWIALLLATPLLALLGDIPALRGRRSVWRLAIRLGPAIILLAIISAATARDFVRADQTAGAAQEE
jgi:hypothetical protein